MRASGRQQHIEEHKINFNETCGGIVIIAEQGGPNTTDDAYIKPATRASNKTKIVMKKVNRQRNCSCGNK